MTHFRMSRSQHLFYGRAIDGPCEGDWLEGESPYYQASVYRRFAGVFSYGELGNVSGEVSYVLYKYLEGYRAWAWVQPNAPPAPRKK